jgi:hypothetical protein
LSEKPKSLGRRLLLPLGLSLGLHALLIACAWLAPSRHAEDGTAEPPPPSLALSVSWEGSKLKSRLHEPGPVLPDDFEPVVHPSDPGIDVKVVSPPAPVQRSEGGAGDVPRGNGGGQAASGKAPPILAAAKARRITYLIDRSSSMGVSGALKRAREEVVASLRALEPDARFRIIAYNRVATPLLSGDWLTPDEATLAAAERRLDELAASGPTDHVRALRQALLSRPEVLFWVTDADELTEDAVREVTRLNNGGASVHVLELAAGRGDPNSLLARLAQNNRGTHRRVAPESRPERR